MSHVDQGFDNPVAPRPSLGATSPARPARRPTPAPAAVPSFRQEAPLLVIFQSGKNSSSGSADGSEFFPQFTSGG